jgi:hypothetical protein
MGNNSFACTCIGGKRTVKKAMKINDVVFMGQVVSKEEIIIPYRLLGTETTINYYFNKFVFKIIKVYKGKIKQDTVEIITGIGNGDCGVRFMQGKKYIVYSV